MGHWFRTVNCAVCVVLRVALDRRYARGRPPGCLDCPLRRTSMRNGETAERRDDERDKAHQREGGKLREERGGGGEERQSDHREIREVEASRRNGAQGERTKETH